MHDNNGDYCRAFDRVYKGPFNRVAVGVARGCELKDKQTDGDVDQTDFAVLQACFGGPDATVSGACKCFDRHPAGNGDNDVDLDDVSAFERCASGSEIALDPACDVPL